MAAVQVSVVIPSYNYGRFLAEAVESALAQTYPIHEVIVVDDGSTDDTRQRLEPYQDRIRYVRQENRGLSAARNRGIAEATGSWIALLDADDLWHPQKTALQIRALEQHPQACLIGATAVGALPFPEHLPAEPTLQDIEARYYLLRVPFAPSSVLARRDCLQRLGGFDESLRSVEDRDMWLRIAVQHPTLLVMTPCWWYRLHPQQMSKRTDIMHQSYRQVLDKFFRNNPEYGNLRPQAEAYLDLDTALSYLSERNRGAAVRYAYRSLRGWPRPFSVPMSGYPKFLRLKIVVRNLKDFLLGASAASSSVQTT